MSKPQTKLTTSKTAVQATQRHAPALLGQKRVIRQTGTIPIAHHGNRIPQHPGQAPFGIQTAETWISGPNGSALFATLHYPAGGAVRGAVVICAPLAKEQIATYRGLRQIAQELAGRGLLVLRFDYAGQGDSSGRQDEPDAVEQWQASIEAAVAYIRQTGIDDIAVVGLRIGALLAASTADRLGDLRALVLWDPIISGRAYGRELTSLYRMSIGEDTSDDGLVSVVGGVLSADAMKRMASLELGSCKVAAETRILAAVRPEAAESARTQRALAQLDAEPMTVHRQNQFVSPSSFVFEVPSQDIAKIAAWIGNQFGEPRTLVQPEIITSAAVGVTAAGQEIWETLERRGKGAFFAISTTVRTAPDDAPTVVFHSTANEHRVGPARLWVESARANAEHGVRSIRFDRSGTGDSGTVVSEENTPIVSAEARRNVLEVLDSITTPPANRMHVGMCSGAWMSAFAAEQRGARSLLLLNIVNWSINNRRPPVKKAHVDALESATANRIFVVAKRIRDGGRAIQRWIPYYAWLGLGYVGLANAPESMLRTLTRKGTRTTVMLSPEDEEWFTANRGRIGMRRLSKTNNPPDLILGDEGDHNLFNRQWRNRVAQQISVEAVAMAGDSRDDRTIR